MHEVSKKVEAIGLWVQVWRRSRWGAMLARDLMRSRPEVPNGARKPRLGNCRGQCVYMVNRASAAGRSAFLPALGVELAAAVATGGRSPLGGDGKVGTISAALARSSRNLSNSVAEMGWSIRIVQISTVSAAQSLRCIQIRRRGRTFINVPDINHQLAQDQIPKLAVGSQFG